MVDPEIIFITCILISTGEIREIIQDMENDNIFSDYDNDEDNNIGDDS